MQKRSFLNIFVVGAGNGTNAILGLLFFTAVARTLPIGDFGKYALLTSLLVSLSKIMDFGTNSLFVAKSITNPQHYVNRFFSLKLILFFVALAAGVLSLNFLNLYTFRILAVFVIGTLGYGINITLFAYFQRVEKFVQAVALNTVPAIIKASFAISVLLGAYKPTLPEAFTVFSLSILSSTVLLFWLPKEFFNVKISKKGVKEFFTDTIPAGISQVIKDGWPAIANSLAKITNTFSEVGIFSLAQKIADIFTLISLSVFTVLLPKNAQRKKEARSYDVRETMLLGVGILLLALVGMVLANFLTVPIFGEKFIESLGLLNILILAASITAIHSFMDNYFFVEEKTKVLMKITLGKLVVFVSLAMVLTPILSLQGLAIANLLAALFALTLTGSFIFRRG